MLGNGSVFEPESAPQAPQTSGTYEPLRDLPVSLNCQLGDPCQSSQFGDTCAKLRDLVSTKHQGPVAVISKAHISPEILKIATEINPGLWLFISITGLGENKALDFAGIERMYLQASECLPNTCAYIRPIIPGRNDNIRKLIPIIDLAARGNRIAIARGYKDVFDDDRPYLYDPKFHEELKKVCEDRGVTLYEKTACSVAAVTGRSCSAHRNDELQTAGLSLLRALGYSFMIEGSEILLDPGVDWTKGDINFVRMIAGRQPVVHNPALSTTKLSLTVQGVPIDCTSSWFTWVRKVPCEIACWYCLDQKPSGRRVVGCNPIDLKDAVWTPHKNPAALRQLIPA